MYDEQVIQLREVEEMLKMAQFKEAAIIIEQAADVIEELSKPKWIPVTERLPEIDKKHHCSKDVLAYLKGGGMCFTALEENIFGQTWFECERHPALEEEMIVTHWMPLPEPPEKESES